MRGWTEQITLLGRGWREGGEGERTRSVAGVVEQQEWGGLMGRKAKGGEAVSRYFEPIVSTSCGSEVIGAGCCRPLPA